MRRIWLGAVVAAFGLSIGGSAHHDYPAQSRAAASAYDQDAAEAAATPPCGAGAPQILAALAQQAYDDGAQTCRAVGFQPARLPGVSLHEGRYIHGPAAALTMTGMLDGVATLVVAFRGSDEPAVWLADLRNINAPYRNFRPLVQAIEAYAEGGRRVVIVGHSAGGAMAQLFMAAHPDDDRYRAVTFGSPGALPQPGVFAAHDDRRITNYAVSDDPFVFLGEHRAQAASRARRDWIYALALAAAIAQQSGLPLGEVLGSEPYLQADYVNNGAKLILQGERPGLTITTAILADPDEHEPATYVARLAAAAPSDRDLRRGS